MEINTQTSYLENIKNRISSLRFEEIGEAEWAIATDIQILKTSQRSLMRHYDSISVPKEENTEIREELRCILFLADLSVLKCLGRDKNLLSRVVRKIEAASDTNQTARASLGYIYSRFKIPYYNDSNVREDPIALLSSSASEGNSLGLLHLMMLCMTERAQKFLWSQYGSTSQAAASVLAHKGIQSGNPWLLSYLSYLCWNNQAPLWVVKEYGEHNKDAALNLLTQSVDFGCAQGQFYLGYLILKGLVPDSIRQEYHGSSWIAAHILFSRAADQGHVAATTQLFKCFTAIFSAEEIFKKYGETRTQAAIKTLDMLVNLNNAEAFYALSNIFLKHKKAANYREFWSKFTDDAIEAPLYFAIQEFLSRRDVENFRSCCRSLFASLDAFLCAEILPTQQQHLFSSTEKNYRYSLVLKQLINLGLKDAGSVYFYERQVSDDNSFCTYAQLRCDSSRYMAFHNALADSDINLAWSYLRSDLSYGDFIKYIMLDASLGQGNKVMISSSILRSAGRQALSSWNIDQVTHLHNLFIERASMSWRLSYDKDTSKEQSIYLAQEAISLSKLIPALHRDYLQAQEIILSLAFSHFEESEDFWSANELRYHLLNIYVEEKGDTLSKENLLAWEGIRHLMGDSNSSFTEDDPEASMQTSRD